MPIHKFTIPKKSRPVITMPTGSKILSCGLQPEGDSGDDAVRVWADVPENAELSSVDVRFEVVGTGCDAPKGFIFLGTLLSHGGGFIRHVFFSGSAPVSKA